MTSYEWIKISWNKNYAPHFIPCCPHLDNPNMLLLLGVPGYVSNNFFTDTFSKYGKIVEVKSQLRPSAIPKFHIPNTSKFFQNKATDNAFRCVFVQFLEDEGLSNFLNAAKMELSYHISDFNNPLVGTRKWAANYKVIYPNEDELRKECEDYMAEFDDREKLKLQREREMADNPDEDGWITVTKSTKFGASVESAQEKKKQYDKKMEKKKKELLHLYSFQDREKRKESLVLLKQKFQEDKEKIAKMKSARKFKPY